MVECFGLMGALRDTLRPGLRQYIYLATRGLN